LFDVCKPKERLALSFSQFCVFRYPSDVKNLKWIDIDEKVIWIRSGKTGGRVFPLVPSIRNVLSIFRAVCGDVDVNEFIFSDVRKHHGSFLSSCISSRMKELRIEKWSRLFNSLRASCITDYVKPGVLSETTIDGMFGNSTMIRKKFYIKSRKNDYDKVSSLFFDEREKFETTRTTFDVVQDLLPLLLPGDLEKLLVSVQKLRSLNVFVQFYSILLFVCFLQLPIIRLCKGYYIFYQQHIPDFQRIVFQRLLKLFSVCNVLQFLKAEAAAPA
jgi:hypothetical protein